MSSGPEYTEVEQPFIDQLIQMGWKYTTGNLDHASTSGRESFREVLIRDDLEKAVRRINLDPQGEPWLDDDRITQAVNAVPGRVVRGGRGRSVRDARWRERAVWSAQRNALRKSRVESC